MPKQVDKTTKTPKVKSVPRHVRSKNEKELTKIRKEQRAIKYQFHSFLEQHSYSDRIANKMEDLFILLGGLLTSGSIKNATYHVLAYIKTHYDVSLTSKIYDVVLRYMERLGAQELDEHNLEVQSGSDPFQHLLDCFKKAKDNWKMFQSSTFFMHVTDLINLVATLGFFPMVGKAGVITLQGFELFRIKARSMHTDAASIIEAFANIVHFFLSRGYKVFMTGDITHFLYTEDELLELDREYQVMIGAEVLLNSGKLHMMGEPGYEDLQSPAQFSVRLNSLIERLDNAKRIEKNSYLCKVLDDKLCKLHKMRASVISNQHLNHFRPCPYSFMISGSSGIGKSTLNAMFITAIAAYNDIPHSEEYKVVINEQDKYDSDIQSHTTIITMDDYGNTKPDKVTEPPTRRIIDLINNITKTAVKAEADQKGCVVVDPKLVTITTNTIDLHAKYFSTEPASILRRFNALIFPRLRSSHINASGRLDSRAVKDNPDAWIFDIYRADIVRNNSSDSPLTRSPDRFTYTKIREDIGIFQILRWLQNDSFEHYSQQNDLVRSYREETCTSCVECRMPKMVCRCDISGEDELDVVKKLAFQSANDNPFLRAGFACRHFVDNLGERVRYFFSNLFACWFQAWIVWYATKGYLTKFIFKSLGYSQPDPLFEVAFKSNMYFVRERFTQVMDTTLFKAYTEHWKAAVASILGIASVLYLIPKLLKMMKYESEFHGATIHGYTIEEKPNVWAKPVFTEVPRQPSSIGVTTHQLENMVQRSIHVIRVQQGEGAVVSNILPLRGNFWIAPSHLFKKDVYHNVSISRTRILNVEGRYSGTISPQMWRKLDNVDLVVVQIPFAGSQPNLVRFMPEGRYVASGLGLSYTYRDHREPAQPIVRREIKLATSRLSYDVEGHNFGGCRYIAPTDTHKGMCIATFITLAKSPLIVGFHVAGNGKNGVMADVCSMDIELCIAQFPMTYSVHSSGDFPTIICGRSLPLVHKVHPKSTLCFQREINEIYPAAEIYGEHTIGRAKFVSNLRTTFISDYLEKMGWEKLHGPIKIHNLKRHWHADSEKRTHVTVSVHPRILDCAVADLTDYISDVCDRIDISCLGPLDKDITLAGLDGVYGLDSVDLTTSMGFPINKQKKVFLKPSTRVVEGISRPLDMPPDLYNYILTMEANYASGVRNYPIFRSTVKDEAMKYDKDKARIFEAAPFWYIFLLRKYFLPMAAIIQKHRLKFCTAVGANAHGLDWTLIVHHLSTFASGKYIAGDYKAFDKTAPMPVLRAAFEMFMVMARKSGQYSSTDLYIMQGLISDLVSPVLEFDGVLMQVFNSHCSGNSLTVLLNNMINLIYMRAAYYHMYACSPSRPFHEAVNILVYGDDNIAEIASDEEMFNHTTCAASLGTMGITYTMADKTSESVPFSPLEDLDFLKRKFRYHEKFDVYMAPLDVQSIMKSLHSYMYSKQTEVSEKEIVAGNISAAFGEFFFHGEEFYNHMAPQLYSCVVAHDLQDLVGPYMTYISREDAYYKKNFVQDDDSSFSVITETSLCDESYEFHMGFESHASRGHPADGRSRRPNVSWFGRTIIIFLLLYINFPNNRKCLRPTRSISRSELITTVSTGLIEPQVYYFQSTREMSAVPSSNFKSSIFTSTSGNTGHDTAVDDAGFDSTYSTVPGNDSDIASFFSRPLDIVSTTVLLNSQTDVSFEPWVLFLNHPTVLAKTRNYKLIKGKLHLRFEISGSSFHYGKFMVTYRPIGVQSIAPNDTFSRLTVNNFLDRVLDSQCQKVFLNPTNSQGAEMHLPFMVGAEYIDLQSLPPGTGMGQIRLYSLQDLRNVADVVGDVTITTYAHMTDVELVSPTAYLPQAAYESGPISKPASNVAAVASIFKSVPYIGKYAMATSSAFAGLSKFAAILGFSKPISLNDDQRMIPFAVGNMSNSNCVDTCFKLSLDSKQEISVDPTLVGLSGKDEMAITNIVQIESYLTNIFWSPGISINPIFTCDVEPSLYALDISNEEAEAYYQTASCVVAQTMTSWKGSMKFRFMVHASALHRGRLRIVYEPSEYNATIQPPDTNVVYSHIIDLSETDDFTVCVGWGSNIMYKSCKSLIPQEPFVLGLRPSPGDVNTTNGRISVYILNSLTSPGPTTAPVEISVFTSMCDDNDFAVPDLNKLAGISPFLFQSAYEYQSGDALAIDNSLGQPDQEQEAAVFNSPGLDPNCHAVYFGEAVKSIRAMMKRYTHVVGEYVPYSNNQLNYVTQIRWRFFGFPGGDPSGLHLVTGGRYNFTNWTYLHWYYLCYAGWRGSTRYKIIPQTGNSPAVSGLVYATATTEAPGEAIDFLTGTQAYGIGAFVRQRFFRSSSKGCALSNFGVKGTLEVELPYYRRRRFQSTLTGTQRGSLDNILTGVGFTMNVANQYADINYFMAAGDDFSLHYWTGPPVVYRSKQPLPAALNTNPWPLPP